MFTIRVHVKISYALAETCVQFKNRPHDISCVSRHFFSSITLGWSNSIAYLSNSLHFRRLRCGECPQIADRSDCLRVSSALARS